MTDIPVQVVTNGLGVIGKDTALSTYSAFTWNGDDFIVEAGFTLGPAPRRSRASVPESIVKPVYVDNGDGTFAFLGNFKLSPTSNKERPAPKGTQSFVVGVSAALPSRTLTVNPLEKLDSRISGIIGISKSPRQPFRVTGAVEGKLTLALTDGQGSITAQPRVTITGDGVTIKSQFPSGIGGEVPGGNRVVDGKTGRVLSVNEIKTLAANQGLSFSSPTGDIRAVANNLLNNDAIAISNIRTRPTQNAIILKPTNQYTITKDSIHKYALKNFSDSVQANVISNTQITPELRKRIYNDRATRKYIAQHLPPLVAKYGALKSAITQAEAQQSPADKLIVSPISPTPFPIDTQEGSIARFRLQLLKNISRNGDITKALAQQIAQDPNIKNSVQQHAADLLKNPSTSLYSAIYGPANNTQTTVASTSTQQTNPQAAVNQTPRNPAVRPQQRRVVAATEQTQPTNQPTSTNSRQATNNIYQNGVTQFIKSIEPHITRDAQGNTFLSQALLNEINSNPTFAFDIQKHAGALLAKHSVLKNAVDSALYKQKILNHIVTDTSSPKYGQVSATLQSWITRDSATRAYIENNMQDLLAQYPELRSLINSSS